MKATVPNPDPPEHGSQTGRSALLLLVRCGLQPKRTCNKPVGSLYPACVGLAGSELRREYFFLQEAQNSFQPAAELLERGGGHVVPGIFRNHYRNKSLGCSVLSLFKTHEGMNLANLYYTAGIFAHLPGLFKKICVTSGSGSAGRVGTPSLGTLNEQSGGPRGALPGSWRHT